MVLVDNGRSELLGSGMREVLRCIRCGACMNHCPVYCSVGGHAYGSIYAGPIGAVLSPALVGVQEAGELAQVRKLIARLKPNGGLWVVYPKGIRAITEMDVINAGRAAGLKDNKVASFSTTHTALRFVIPLTAR